MINPKNQTALQSTEIGQLGEQIARHYLWAHQHKVLIANYQAPKGGEIDIVARNSRTLLFIEVKTRQQALKFRPSDSVNFKKRQLIRKAAWSYLNMLNGPIPIRFDIIEVIISAHHPPNIHWLKNAFGSNENNTPT